jgi:hypothetical protein
LSRGDAGPRIEHAGARGTFYALFNAAGLKAVRFRPGLGWSLPAPGSVPALSLLPDGRAIVAWTSFAAKAQVGATSES